MCYGRSVPVGAFDATLGLRTCRCRDGVARLGCVRRVTRAPTAKSRPRASRSTTTVKGLVSPWGFQFLPDGRMLVTEIAAASASSKGTAGSPARQRRAAGGGERPGRPARCRTGARLATSGTIYLTFSEPRGNGRSGTSLARARLALAGASGRLEGSDRHLPPEARLSSAHALRLAHRVCCATAACS